MTAALARAGLYCRRMTLLPDLAPLIARHGYLTVGLVIGLESMGVPLPGETLLIAASLSAAR